MRILIAALAGFVLSLLAVLPISAESLPAGLVKVRDVLLAILTLYIAVEAWLKLRERAPAAPPVAAPQPVPPPVPPAPRKDEPSAAGEALVLLSLLQGKGRFLDFVMEDITAYSDAQVAAASRVVHQGCAAVVKEYLEVSPVHGGKEGDRITIDKAADPDQYRLVGKVAGAPPFSGVVVHRGWKTAKIALPRLIRPADAAARNVIAPVEVEIK